jgi:hypothetical protein
MKSVIKLTNNKDELILIGVNQIIQVTSTQIKRNTKDAQWVTEIRSVGAMVSTNWVIESVEEIYELINS